MMHALTNLALNPVQRGDVIYFGNGESINVKTGQAQLSPNRTAAQIKQAYSTAILQRTAKARGWTLKQTAPNKFQVIKR